MPMPGKAADLVPAATCPLKAADMPPTAFTLVELLVVVAILTLLISILLPSLLRARRQAQMAVCGSNLRQIALANQLYAGDNGHSYCPGAAEFMLRNLHRWHGTRQRQSQPFDGRDGPLVPYLGSTGGIRACPSLTINLPDNDPRRFEKNCGGYGYNLAYVGQRMERSAAGYYRVTTDLVGVQAEHVLRPAETIMFADSAFLSGELIEYSFAEPRFFPTFGTRADPSIHFRHNGKANVVWCDGHVDGRVRSFTWSSGLYAGNPAQSDVGWFGQDDDNGYFDLE